MTGRLRTSFRSGDLAEHLGILLLKGISAVAQVPRPEDVGLDAIATLLRRDEDGNCYAEDSFLVQLKSESVTTLQLAGHELDWFLGQTQPMFIGLISRSKSQISLYSTLFVNHAVRSLHARKVTVRFGVSNVPPLIEGHEWSPWKGESNHSATVWLGEPVLRWTLSDLLDEEWVKRTYEMLKRFLGVAQRELELLSFGQFSVLKWSTNDAASISSQFGMMKGHPDDLKSLAKRCAPCLQAVMFHAVTMREESGNPLMISLLSMAGALRDIGVEIDPHDLFPKCFVASQHRPVYDHATGQEKETRSRPNE